MRCPRCQAEVEPTARFCEDCGGRLEPRCPACGQPVTPGKSFCRSCGASLAAGPSAEPAQAPGRTPPAAERAPAPESYTPPHLARKILTSRSALAGERKQVTVLFCDLVGSTALAERLGPDAMHELLDRFFGLALAEVHRYEGTLNQFLGDGFMALFGAPIAHEDHARRAALAALAIRRALGAAPPVATAAGAEPLRVRMGLNTGLVVVGAIGDNLRMDYTAVGDTTHLAARLQQLAEPGDILLSDATARLVEGYVTVEPRGEVPVRGLARPQPVHRLTGLGARRSRLDAAGAHALSPFVGRARELAALEEILERVRRAQGQVVGVVGEAGLGKSRLLLELRQAPGARDVTWLEGRCQSYGAAIPYLPVVDVVRAACGIVETDEPGVALGKLRDRLDALGLEVAARGPYLAHLLGLKAEDEGELATLGADVIMERTFEALRQLVLRCGRERPTVLAVEDLHWVDRTSESVLASLADGLARAPVLLIATYRPGYRPAWLDKSYATQLALDPLAVEDSLTVLRSTAAGALLGEASLRPVLDRAEGNPFFLEELARVVGEPAGAARAAALPATVQDVLVARIDRLPETTKRVLQTAAVLGREFSARLLAAVWDADEALEPHLLELTRLEFLHERPDLDEPAHAFKHALTQEVAASTLLGPQRRALHRRAAEALPRLYPGRARELAPVLVHHALRAEAWAEAVAHARDAAEAARAAYANEEARAHYDQALEAAGRAALPSAERRALLEARAGIHETLGAFDPARADLETALALAEADSDLAARARLLGRLGALWGGHRDYERGLALAEQAVALLREGGDAGTRAEAHARLGIMLLNLGRMRQSRAQLARARALWRAAGDRLGEARAHEMLAMNLGLSGQVRRARAHAERALRELAGSGLHAEESAALLSLASWNALCEGPAASGPYFERGLEVARRAGLRAAEAFAHGLAAEVGLPFGAYGRSHAGATACLAIAEAIGHREWSALGLSVLGRVHHACGDAHGAQRVHERMLEVARELRTTLWIAGALQFLGQDLLLAGDLDGAAAHFTECLAVGGEEVKDVAYALLGLAEVALARHRPDEARALVERYRASGDWPVHLPDAGRLWAAALVQQGRRDEAERALVEARDLALSLGAVPGAWRARLALARLLHEAGRPTEARGEAGAARDALEAVAADLPDAALRASLEGSAAVRDARALAEAPR